VLPLVALFYLSLHRQKNSPNNIKGENMKNIKNLLIFFSVGAAGYGLIEILWRGHTHPSMLACGGLCFTAFGKIAERFKKAHLLYKAIIASAFVTVLEFIFGYIFNLVLKKGVWDYSKIPFNFKGQICILYSVFWWILGLVFIPLAEILNNRLKNNKKML
jgi:uncharacterized membrane protein